MAVLRSTRSSIVAGLVFKKMVKEEDPNLAGAPGVYEAYTLINITPGATSVAGGEQTFSPAELADLDVNDFVDVKYIGGAIGANVVIANVRCSATGTIAIDFKATSGTPTPAAGNYAVFVKRVA